VNPDPALLAAAPCTCARCWAPVRADAAACPSCSTPFSGAGRFDRIQGPPPSAFFAAPTLSR
jgi:predicted amidophosphoribosyltransferase